MILAIQLHYPKVFAGRLKKSKAVQALLQWEWDGEIIKLYRLARAGISGYL